MTDHDSRTLTETDVKLTDDEWGLLNLAAIGYHTRSWAEKPDPATLLATDGGCLAVTMALDNVAPLIPAVERIIRDRLAQAWDESRTKALEDVAYGRSTSNPYRVTPPAEPHQHAIGEACFETCPGWSVAAPGGRGYRDTPPASSGGQNDA